MKALLVIVFSALVWSAHAFTVPAGLISLRSSSPFRHSTALTAQSDGYPFRQQTESKQEADRRQLLGMPAASAASDSTPLWKISLQLTKPVTWIPLAAGVMCGAAASGNYHWIWNPFNPNDRDVLLGLEDAAKGLVTMILAGPFMEGYSQTINDWYDKDIDAVNEPYRPIPSGAISEAQVWKQILLLALGSIAISFGVDVWAHHDFPTVMVCALIGTLVGYIYSAPPLRLKQNGWSGDVAIGLCYITLPWWCGHAAFGELNLLEFWLLPMVYSLGGIAPAIVNDFKSIKGDSEFGIDSLPVMYGPDVAKWIAAAAQTLPQLAISLYLYSVGEGIYATALVALLLPQLYFIKTLLIADPIENDVKFQASCQPFFFLGLVLTSICMGNHDWSAIAS